MLRTVIIVVMLRTVSIRHSWYMTKYGQDFLHDNLTLKKYIYYIGLDRRPQIPK